MAESSPNEAKEAYINRYKGIYPENVLKQDASLIWGKNADFSNRERDLKVPLNGYNPDEVHRKLLVDVLLLEPDEVEIYDDAPLTASFVTNNSSLYTLGGLKIIYRRIRLMGNKGKKVDELVTCMQIKRAANLHKYYLLLSQMGMDFIAIMPATGAIFFIEPVSFPWSDAAFSILKKWNMRGLIEKIQTQRMRMERIIKGMKMTPLYENNNMDEGFRITRSGNICFMPISHIAVLSPQTKEYADQYVPYKYRKFEDIPTYDAEEGDPTIKCGLVNNNYPKNITFLSLQMSKWGPMYIYEVIFMDDKSWKDSLIPNVRFRTDTTTNRKYDYTSRIEINPVYIFMPQTGEPNPTDIDRKKMFSEDNTNNTEDDHGNTGDNNNNNDYYYDESDDIFDQYSKFNLQAVEDARKRVDEEREEERRDAYERQKAEDERHNRLFNPNYKEKEEEKKKEEATKEVGDTQDLFAVLENKTKKTKTNDAKEQIIDVDELEQFVSTSATPANNDKTIEYKLLLDDWLEGEKKKHSTGMAFEHGTFNLQRMATEPLKSQLKVTGHYARLLIEHAQKKLVERGCTYSAVMHWDAEEDTLNLILDAWEGKGDPVKYPVTWDEKMDAYSLTKTIVSLLTMEQVFKEKIPLDTPIAKFLPAYIKYSEKLSGVTLGSIMSHTAKLITGQKAGSFGLSDILNLWLFGPYVDPLTHLETGVHGVNEAQEGQFKYDPLYGYTIVSNVLETVLASYIVDEKKPHSTGEAVHFNIVDFAKKRILNGTSKTLSWKQSSDKEQFIQHTHGGAGLELTGLDLLQIGKNMLNHYKYILLFALGQNCMTNNGTLIHNEHRVAAVDVHDSGAPTDAEEMRPQIGYDYSLGLWIPLIHPEMQWVCGIGFLGQYIMVSAKENIIAIRNQKMQHPITSNKNRHTGFCELVSDMIMCLKIININNGDVGLQKIVYERFVSAHELYTK